MNFVSDQALADLKDAVQKGATVVESVITFAKGIPQLIRDAVTAAESNGTDVSDAVEDVVKQIEGQATQLAQAIATTSDGSQPAPVGNLPASDNSSADSKPS